MVFAGADIALQQTAHGAGLAHVAHDLGESSLLGFCGVEGQHLPQRIADVVFSRKGDPGPLAQFPSLQLQSEFEIKQLFEDQPPVRGRGPFRQLRKPGSLGRKMDFAEAGLAVGQFEPVEHVRRQTLWNRTAHAFEQMEHHFAQPAGVQTLAAQGLIDGCNATHLQHARLGVRAGVGQDLKLRLDDLHRPGRARRLNLAIHSDRLAGLKLVFQVTAVEPDALDRQTALPQHQLEDGLPRGADQAGPAHFSDDTRHFAGLQFVETAGILAVFVAKGQMVKQIFSSFNTLAEKQVCDARADALDIHHRTVEGRHTSDAKSAWLPGQKQVVRSIRQVPHS